MAPPRQRPLPNSIPGGDDSRSEASSTATGGPTPRGIPGPKPRKSTATNTSGAATMGTLASAKDLKVAAATGAAAAANATAASLAQNGVEYGGDGIRDDLPGVCFYRTPPLTIVAEARINANGDDWIDTMASNAPLNPARLQTRLQTLYTKRIRPPHFENIFLLWRRASFPNRYSS